MSQPRPVLVYLAAAFTRAPELLAYAKELQALGVQVTSRWLLGDHQLTYERLKAMDPEQALAFERKCAREDIEDVQRADWLISFVGAEANAKSRGGRHVEFGIALALGKRLINVGQDEHIFHFLPEVESFETWDYAKLSLFGARAEAVLA